MRPANKWLLLLLMTWGLFPTCSQVGKSVRTLPPEDKKFLSEVRYIIAKKEKEIFLNTPPSERQAFIEEFWRKRDPDPSTEENEFRIEYYDRIDQANHLFREGSSGWLSDRGRIYILFGPPERRLTYPMGYSFYEKPAEVWYYGNFPIVFIDNSFSGVYKLEQLSAQHIAMLTQSETRLQPQIKTSGLVIFDFILRVESAPGKGTSLLLLVPYKSMRLTQNSQTGSYETILQTTFAILGAKQEKILEKKSETLVSLTEKMLQQLPPYQVIEFPLELPAGDFTAVVSMVNSTDHSQVTKKLNFKI